jgi:hypothetical protein
MKFTIIEEKQPMCKGSHRHGEISDQKRRHELALAQKLEPSQHQRQNRCIFYLT